MTQQTDTNIHALSGAYAIDAVDDLERARFERHLDTCAECRAEVASLREAAGELAHLASVMPPARLRDMVLSDISQVRPLPPLATAGASSATTLASSGAVSAPETRGGRHEARRPRRATRWLVAAAAVIAIGGGSGVVANQVLSQRSSQTQSQSAIAERVLQDPDAVRTNAAVGSGTLEVVSSKSAGHAVVVASDLAALPSNQVYQLWLQKGSTFTSAGLLTGPLDQTRVLQGDALGAQAVGITVEPAGGSNQPTSKPLALIQMA